MVDVFSNPYKTPPVSCHQAAFLGACYVIVAHVVNYPAAVAWIETQATHYRACIAHTRLWRATGVHAFGHCAIALAPSVAAETTRHLSEPWDIDAFTILDKQAIGACRQIGKELDLPASRLYANMRKLISRALEAGIGWSFGIEKLLFERDSLSQREMAKILRHVQTIDVREGLRHGFKNLEDDDDDLL